MQDYTARYRQYLDSMAERVDASNPSALLALYEKLRLANERFIEKNPNFTSTGRDRDLRDAVERAIEQFEAERTTLAPTAPAGQQEYQVVHSTDMERNSRKPLIFAMLAGIALSVVVALVAVASGVIDVSGATEARRKNSFEAAYQRALPDFRTVVASLQEVKTEIEQRQASGPAGLAQIAERQFVPLDRVDPALGERMTQTLPANARFVVRADRTGYKIVTISPLCQIASIDRPDLVDPQRASDSFFCTHFGVWNEAGAEF